MTADNPTVDDLRLVARNLEAEKHKSRALILNNAADKMERLEALVKDIKDVLELHPSHAELMIELIGKDIAEFEGAA